MTSLLHQPQQGIARDFPRTTRHEPERHFDCGENLRVREYDLALDDQELFAGFVERLLRHHYKSGSEAQVLDPRKFEAKIVVDRHRLDQPRQLRRVHRHPRSVQHPQDYRGGLPQVGPADAWGYRTPNGVAEFGSRIVRHRLN